MQSQLDKTAADRSSLYNEDFFEWTRRNAELLRAGRFEQADIYHIAEEIEDMGKRDLRALASRLEVLLVHLLKSRFQPEKRSPSWQNTVAVQRRGLDRLLDRYPSFRRRIKTDLASSYRFAVRRAVAETALTRDQFPNECPFTLEQILDPEFLP